ncbi:hypothetical protein NMG60_11013195 [Bertholletia excelsa]
MGKRKRRTEQKKTPPLMDAITYSPPKEQKSSGSVDSTTIKSLSSIMEIMDNPRKIPHGHHSHQNFSRTVMMRHPRHYYSHHYSRRNSAHNACTSTSRGKGILHDEKFSFKFASQINSVSGCYTESKRKQFWRPERIRSSSLAADAASPNAQKMVCGLCGSPLKRRPHSLGHTLSSSDLSVVAVLACGHVYHAECLEQRTCHEERQDPPCPLCKGLILQLDASGDLD